MEIDEILHRAGEQEVERAQAEDGADVGGVDDEGIGRDAEDGGNGIEGEDEVGHLHHEEHEEEQR